MICPKCSFQNADGASFCFSCNQSLPLKNQSLKPAAKNYLNKFIYFGAFLAILLNTGIIKRVFASDSAVGFFALLSAALIFVGVFIMLRGVIKDRRDKTN